MEWSLVVWGSLDLMPTLSIQTQYGVQEVISVQVCFGHLNVLRLDGM